MMKMAFASKFKQSAKGAPGGAKRSAKGAEYESQGQARSEAERVAPGYRNRLKRALKVRNSIAYLFRSFRASGSFTFYQGRRAPLRFALAPGFHIPRRWRSVSGR